MSRRPYHLAILRQAPEGMNWWPTKDSNLDRLVSKTRASTNWASGPIGARGPV